VYDNTGATRDQINEAFYAWRGPAVGLDSIIGSLAAVIPPGHVVVNRADLDKLIDGTRYYGVESEALEAGRRISSSLGDEDPN